MKKKIGFLFVLVLLAFCGSIMVGKTFFSFDLWLALWQQTLTASQSLIFFDFRLPRAVLALIAGSAFGFSGFLLQGVTRNELADASILGINNGAGLCVMLYLGFYAQGSQLLPLIGMIGGLLAALLVYAIAYKQRQLLSMERILLSGIASASLLLTVQLSKERYSFVTAWLSGTIWGTSWTQVLSLLPWFLILGLLAFMITPLINLLGFGEEQAISLGVPLNLLRTGLLFVAIGLAASSVGYTGNLSFIGLLAPHIAKRLIGKESRWALIAAGMIGAILVLVSDTVGRLLLQSGEIPAGIVIAIIGAPYFLFLLIRQKT